MNRIGDMLPAVAEAARARAEHAQTCTAKTCGQCQRWACAGCQEQIVSTPGGSCEDCRKRSRARNWRIELDEAIPAAFREASLDAPWLLRLVGPVVLDQARTAVARGVRRVAAEGPPGSGKTSLLAAMLRALEPERGRVLWVSAHQLAKARALHPLGEGEAPLISSALRVGRLIVDELGGEDQRYASAVSEVLYERHAHDLATWVTTGVDPKAIAERYGGGIARRVFEDAGRFRLGGKR